VQVNELVVFRVSRKVSSCEASASGIPARTGGASPNWQKMPPRSRKPVPVTMTMVPPLDGPAWGYMDEMARAACEKYVNGCEEDEPASVLLLTTMRTAIES